MISKLKMVCFASDPGEKQQRKPYSFLEQDSWNGKSKLYQYFKALHQQLSPVENVNTTLIYISCVTIGAISCQSSAFSLFWLEQTHEYVLINLFSIQETATYAGLLDSDEEEELDVALLRAQSLEPTRYFDVLIYQLNCLLLQIPFIFIDIILECEITRYPAYGLVFC